jgi:hypothetical protein
MTRAVDVAFSSSAGSPSRLLSSQTRAVLVDGDSPIFVSSLFPNVVFRFLSDAVGSSTIDGKYFANLLFILIVFRLPNNAAANSGGGGDSKSLEDNDVDDAEALVLLPFPPIFRFLNENFLNGIFLSF